jgi:trehalose 6-phosphate phosphatase
MTPPPPLALDQALFLDFDGTLAPIEATPDAVRYQEDRAALLTRLAIAMRGALAILSGRTLKDIDRLLGPGRPAGAVHGLVRRRADGSRVEHASGQTLEAARAALQPLLDRYPGLILEDKGVALAIHFRLAPHAADTVREFARRAAKAHGLGQQAGDMVCELRAPGPDKGDALKAFMAEPPFQGRIPVAVGDDLTDEHAFGAAQTLGGFGVLVGAPRPTLARYRLENVAAVLSWLRQSLKEAA